MKEGCLTLFTTLFARKYTQIYGDLRKFWEKARIELATVIVNDSVTREAITKEQMRKFLKFIHDDNVYCKYYEVVYILFHMGMRISEF